MDGRTLAQFSSIYTQEQAHVHMRTCSHTNAHASNVMKHQNADYKNMLFPGFFVK